MLITRLTDGVHDDDVALIHVRHTDGDAPRPARIPPSCASSCGRPRPISCRGRLLMRRLSDRLHTERGRRGTTVTITWLLAP
ncbi:MAG: hypothetical protein J0I34_00200 [Pseudonocardia sp.]|uniref:hypothetical protein n=1 Tax=unclassified Pseudonocardia TaxID=2619320 RepID=UPI00086ABC78|nr:MULTISPECIES: hypothetical protein [unclassified Pseudonocardia]MBN9107176.1 hypothetical protein [Pseudonocardia sp.]ODU26931.1 MAG: hypothetical protein ABS80_04895 [Pseudonocardia sp. SCN 72-51]ODV05292.1 MAG: hypothetical protein ABT15_17480 [Pseudonocardia sp. SCN 73-27]